MEQGAMASLAWEHGTVAFFSLSLVRTGLKAARPTSGKPNQRGFLLSLVLSCYRWGVEVLLLEVR